MTEYEAYQEHIRYTHDSKYYLHIPVTYEVEESNISDICNVVGIDRGINFVVATYDSKHKSGFVSGKAIKQKRANYSKLRKELQMRHTPSSRRRLKAIGQRENRWMQDVNHQLFTESVLDEVLISMKEENEEKALDILKSLDLLEYRERHPVSLSGGEKQRVAVATAIASERSVLLFDEPTSGLDYRHMLQVARLFEKLRNHGKTILVVTHDLEFIEALHANTICLEELQA